MFSVGLGNQMTIKKHLIVLCACLFICSIDIESLVCGVLCVLFECYGCVLAVLVGCIVLESSWFGCHAVPAKGRRV